MLLTHVLLLQRVWTEPVRRRFSWPRCPVRLQPWPPWSPKPPLTEWPLYRRKHTTFAYVTATPATETHVIWALNADVGHFWSVWLGVLFSFMGFLSCLDSKGLKQPSAAAGLLEMYFGTHSSSTILHQIFPLWLKKWEESSWDLPGVEKTQQPLWIWQDRAGRRTAVLLSACVVDGAAVPRSWVNRIQWVSIEMGSTEKHLDFCLLRGDFES